MEDVDHMSVNYEYTNGDESSTAPTLYPESFFTYIRVALRPILPSSALSEEHTLTAEPVHFACQIGYNRGAFCEMEQLFWVFIDYIMIVEQQISGSESAMESIISNCVIAEMWHGVWVCFALFSIEIFFLLVSCAHKSSAKLFRRIQSTCLNRENMIEWVLLPFVHASFPWTKGIKKKTPRKFVENRREREHMQRNRRTHTSCQKFDRRGCSQLNFNPDMDSRENKNPSGSISLVYCRAVQDVACFLLGL